MHIAGDPRFTCCSLIIHSNTTYAQPWRILKLGASHFEAPIRPPMGTVLSGFRGGRGDDTMTETVTDAFSAHRDHMMAVAYRMLGSRTEAEDAVQEAWLRYAGADTSQVTDLRAWLTTVTGRICLDQL